MKHLKKLTMTLVALFAISTGAWADPQEELLTTVTATGQTTYSQSPDGIVTVTLNNITKYDGDYGWLWGGTVTVEAASDDYEITRCVFIQNAKDPLEDDLAPFTATLTVIDGVYAETKTGQEVAIMDGITSIEVYGVKKAAAPVGTDQTPDATRKIWTLDAMPAGNVELLVAYYPGMLNLAQADGGTIALNYEGDALPEGFEKDDDGNIYVADKTEFKVKATPADGFRLASLMFGETDITDQVDADGIATITMPEGNTDITLTAAFSNKYVITFAAANANTIQDGKATVTVGTEQKTLGEEGKLKQVQMGQTVTIEATTGYKFRKVEAKNGITPATALSPALVNGATVVFTFIYKGSITTFTCTNNKWFVHMRCCGS